MALWHKRLRELREQFRKRIDGDLRYVFIRTLLSDEQLQRLDRAYGPGRGFHAAIDLSQVEPPARRALIKGRGRSALNPLGTVFSPPWQPPSAEDLVWAAWRIEFVGTADPKALDDFALWGGLAGRYYGQHGEPSTGLNDTDQFTWIAQIERLVRHASVPMPWVVPCGPLTFTDSRGEEFRACQTKPAQSLFRTSVEAIDAILELERRKAQERRRAKAEEKSGGAGVPLSAKSFSDLPPVDAAALAAADRVLIELIGPVPVPEDVQDPGTGTGEAPPVANVPAPQSIRLSTVSESPPKSTAKPLASPGDASGPMGLLAQALPASKRRRNQGKRDACLGVYIRHLVEKKPLPTSAELVEMFGCHKSTVSRALAKYNALLQAYGEQSLIDKYQRDP